MIFLILGMLVLATALGLHAILVAPVSLRTTVIDVPLHGLSPEFEGYVLSVLADIHHREPGGSGHLRRIVAASNAANPDVVVLLGDYGISFRRNRRLSAIAYRRALPVLGTYLSTLQSRDGLIAVLGNHDHYYDADCVVEWLGGIGARTLVNDHVVIRREGTSLVMSGVGDADEGQVDPLAGVRNKPADAPLIVLSHNPDAVLSLSAEAGIGLVVSGHTHGGQVVFPGYGAPITRSRICGRQTASGWVPNATAPLYVTTGAGSQIPIRFRCPPEVLIIRLRLKRDQQPA